MKMMLRSIAMGWILASGATAWAADEVEYIDASGKKETARGVIREENAREIVVQTSKDTVHVPVDQIDHVRYDKQPVALASVRSKERQGRWAEAIDDYKEVAASLGEGKEKLQGAVAFGIFRATAELAISDPSKLGEVERLYEKWSDQFRGTRFFYPVQELLGRAYLAAGQHAKATSAFAPLKELEGPGAKEKAALYQATCWLQQKKFAEATKEVDAVIAGAGPSALAQTRKRVAQVYKGEILLAEGKAAEAEKLLRAELEAVPAEMTEVLARGHNALGDAMAANKRDPKDTMLDGYLWTLVVYNQNPEELARAMYNLRPLFEAIGQKERAEEMATRLRADFPNSQWTKKLGGT